MALILGIETSCDETAAAVYDDNKRRILSNVLATQIDMHSMFGGVVPEIASRSHLEKIGGIVSQALKEATVSLDDIDGIGVTNQTGLMGSLLVGVCFAKGIAWVKQKKLIGINHLEGHVFSAFLGPQGGFNDELQFPYVCLSVSGGHTSLYVVHDFGNYELLGQTLDDAAGEALDKTAAILGLGYPGGPQLEKRAKEVDNADFFHYPRGKVKKDFDFSFSGLKTAVLYDLVKKGAFDLAKGIIKEGLTSELQSKVASSLQVCIADIFVDRLQRVLTLYHLVKHVVFVGGVSANKYITARLQQVSAEKGVFFWSPPLQFCGDNGAMIAFIASYKMAQGQVADFTLDAVRR